MCQCLWTVEFINLPKVCADSVLLHELLFWLNPTWAPNKTCNPNKFTISSVFEKNCSEQLLQENTESFRN